MPCGPTAGTSSTVSYTHLYAYTVDGGLAVLTGNLAPDGCIVKTAGVPEHQWTFRGPAKVAELSLIHI